VVIRFYIDADLIGLGRVLVNVRSDGTNPGDHGGLGVGGLNWPLAQPKGERDAVWIPLVAKEGGIVITRDRHLQHRPDEHSAILEQDAKVIRLDARHELNKWLQLEIVVTQWRRGDL
jgi:hypothetical protein